MVQLDCEVYSPGKRAATTEKQHEAIKNCELTGLDLLVREMIQNSLDAALDEDKTKSVSVIFTRGLFDVEGFAKCLGKEKTFGGSNYSRLLLDYVKKSKCPNSYLAIRDVGCVGLDGDVDDKKSRAWKLPFGFFDGQKADSTTGGANGVGKVVAFRFGIGFVIYYSRTRDARSRFVVAFMDDGTRNVFPTRTMPDGAAWWGKKRRGSQLGVVCVENEAEIKELLKIFQIKPYPRGRSGTMTIIPFFNEKECLRNATGRFPVEYCPWVRDFDSYLRFCINQWYAPRLRGDVTVMDPEEIGDVTPYYWGRSLKKLYSWHDDHALATKVFDLFRELYDVAVGACAPRGDIKRLVCPLRRNSPKRGISFIGDNFGWVAVKKINYKVGEYSGVLPVLCALAPGSVDDEDGENFMGKVSSRRGFLLYCRRHGMIVSYERDWDDACYVSLPRPQDGEFYVGMFVVDSDSMVKSDTIKNSTHTASIDVVFRSFEKTDHYGWPRHAAYGELPIVPPLLKQIKAKLSAEFRNDGSLASREPLERLSTLLGRFVSSVGCGFGDGPNPTPDGVGGIPGVASGTATGRNGGGRGGATGGRMSIKQEPPIYELVNHRTIVSIPIVIGFSQKDLCAEITCGIAQDGNSAVLHAEDFPLGDLPVSLVEVKIREGAASVSVDRSKLFVRVYAEKKSTSTIVCRFELKRKDVALALDCKPSEKEGV